MCKIYIYRYEIESYSVQNYKSVQHKNIIAISYFIKTHINVFLCMHGWRLMKIFYILQCMNRIL